MTYSFCKWTFFCQYWRRSVGIDPVEGGQQHKGHFYHFVLVREDLPAHHLDPGHSSLEYLKKLYSVQQHAQEAPIGSQTQGVDGLWWKRWKLMPKILNLWFFLKYVYFSVYAQSFFPINLAPIFPTSNWNFELLECHRAIIFFAAVIYMFCHCAYEISWPSMKNCGPDRAAKFIFFRWKAIFRYTTFESCRDHNFSSIGSRNFVCTISIHIPTHSKKNCSRTLRR